MLGLLKLLKFKTERTLRRTRAPNQKWIVCAFGNRCGWVLCVSAPESEFGRMMSWIGSSPVANNFKRWSVEQLKGACSCYFMYSSTKPYFSLLVHSTILISCYLQFQAYIFFHSINFSASILCLTLFCSDCKYLMLCLFCNVGSVLLGLQIFNVGFVL